MTAVLPDDKDIFAKWVESKAPPEEVPLLARWFGTPRYALPTIQKRNQPFYDQHRDLYDEIGATLPNDELGHWHLPDPDFWTPSPAMQEKLTRLHALEAQRFVDIPNPDYDPVKAAEWEVCSKRQYFPTKIFVGQSYRPIDPNEPPPSAYVANVPELKPNE